MKQASKVKQTNKAKQHSTPKAVTFPMKMICLGWESNPRHSTLYTERSTTLVHCTLSHMFVSQAYMRSLGSRSLPLCSYLNGTWVNRTKIGRSFIPTIDDDKEKSWY